MESDPEGLTLTTILDDSGKILLLGNEAIARGAIEAGVRFASTYPGTPSSEIGGTLERIGDKAGMYFEYCPNEKVAMEAAAAAAASNVRSFAFMKHVGLNVAADAMMTLAYTGVRGGMVILTADDPSCHSSQNEQDNRLYCKISLLPMLEPSTPAEAKDMIVAAFDISEELESPIIIRTTTRVNHSRGVIELGPRRPVQVKGEFERDPKRFVTIPAHARINRLKLLERRDRAREMAETSPFNRMIDRGGRIGVITSGVAATYAMEWFPEADILKLGFTYPVPEDMVAKFLEGHDKVLVFEELEPYLEDEVMRIAHQRDLDVEVLGKHSGHLPMEYEYSPDTALSLSSLLNVMHEPEPLQPPEVKLPGRPPMLCAGCPHRSTYYAAKKALGKDGAIYCTDIGCYTLGIQPPMRMADFLVCMGSSVGSANGFSEVTDGHVMAFLGDSTFFHSGVGGLLDGVFNGHKYTAVILDNRTTAMTGHQPNPGTGRQHGGRFTQPIPIEPLVRGAGVEFVEEIDPYDLKSSVAAFKRALEHPGVSVIIAKAPCPLLLRKQKKLAVKTYHVDQDECSHCFVCVERFACPAMYREGDQVFVDASVCIGCGSCAEVCPKGAIKEVVK